MASNFSLRERELSNFENIPYLSLGHMNSNLTFALAKLNIRRIVRLMQSSQDYHAFKFAALGAVLNCSNYPSAHIPVTLQQKMSNYRRYKSDQIQKAELQYLSYFPNETRPDRYKLETMAKIRHLFESRGVSIEDWFMSFNRDAYGAITPLSFFRELAQWMVYKDPELEAMSCQYTAKNSLERLHRLREKVKLSEALKLDPGRSLTHQIANSSLSDHQKLLVHSAFDRCKTCHTKREGPSYAPQIQLNNLSRDQKNEIARRIQLKGPQKMPPQSDLSPETIEALINFLNSGDS